VCVKISRFESGSISKGLGCVCSRVDSDIHRRVLEVVVEQWVGRVSLNYVHVIISRFGRLVLDGVCSISVVANIGRDEISAWRLDLHVEQISTIFLWFSVRKYGVNSENTFVSALVSRFESRSFSI
jgi:hypothetical protein